MAVHFQLPDCNNYSPEFLECRRALSPYPDRGRRESNAITSSMKDGLAAKVETIKHYFTNSHRRHRHKTVSITSRIMDDMGMQPLTRVHARRFLSPRHERAVRFDEVRAVRVDEVHGRGKWEDDKDEEEVVAEDGERRGWGQVLEWMHREGINMAGYKVSVQEREACANGACKCLGPLAKAF